MEWSKESIVSRRFSKKVMGGISEFEVRDFLHVLAEEIRHLRQLNINQGKKLAEKEELIKDYRDREHILRQSIASAQEVADKIRKDAEKRAQLILDGAGGKSEAMIQDARHSLQTVYNDIADLKRLYLQFKTSLRASLQAQMELLEQGPLFTTPLPFDESVSEEPSEGGLSQGSQEGAGGYGGPAPEGGLAEPPGQNFGPGQSFQPEEAGLEGSALEPEGAPEALGAKPEGPAAGRKSPGGEFPGEAFGHKESEEPSGKKLWKWPEAQSGSLGASFVEAPSSASKRGRRALSEFSAEPEPAAAPAAAAPGAEPGFQDIFQSPAQKSGRGGEALHQNRRREAGQSNRNGREAGQSNRNGREAGQSNRRGRDLAARPVQRAGPGPAARPPEAPSFSDPHASAASSAKGRQAQPALPGRQGFFEGRGSEMRALKSSLRSLNKDFS